MFLDFDMKELTVEITKEELLEKKEKINELMKKIKQEIQELEELIHD